MAADWLMGLGKCRKAVVCRHEFKYEGMQMFQWIIYQYLKSKRMIFYTDTLNL